MRVCFVVLSIASYCLVFLSVSLKKKCLIVGRSIVPKELVLVMEFCPECGTRMVSRRKKDGTKVTVQTVCTKCGHKKPAKHSKPVAAKTIKRPSKERITVIAKEHQIRTLPTNQIACPKCGNNLAYVWQVQTRGGDEGSTLFFRCTKCNHTFREYT